MKTIGLIVALGLLLAGCAGTRGGDEGPSSSAPASSMVEVPAGTVRFVLLGDTGMGNEAQAKVARAVKSVCDLEGCQFVLIAGDNIYPSGVRNAYDPQFEEKFEKPYAGVDLPFYLVLGNHDNGNGAGSNPEAGDSEVEYHLRSDRLSDKWHMPARYYSLTFGDVQIFGLDSGPSEVSQDAVWGPNARGPVMQQWLASELAKSTAKWKFAFAHHPYLSNSVHGNAGTFDNVAGRGLSYKLMLEQTICDQIQVFLTGHDHNLQWLKPVRSCGKTEFIVSGAGGASLYAKGVRPINEFFFEDYTHHGFFWIDITGNKFTGVAYDDEGKELFERTLTMA